MNHYLHRMGIAATLASTLALVACSDDDDGSTNDATGGSAASGGSGAEAGAPGTGGTGNAGGAAGAPSAIDSIIATATAAGTFETLLGALEATSLTSTLEGEGPFTVFAPTDAAFAAFEAEHPGLLASLTTEELAAILTYHVVAGEVLSTDLVGGSLVETLNGARAAVDLTDGVQVDGAVVTTADLRASNGVIHVVDRLLLPPTDNLVEAAVAAGNFTTLAGALVDTGLDETLSGDGPFTVFAPTDEAFEAFEAANPGVLAGLATEELADILLYHVAEGWAAAADLSDGQVVPTQLAGQSVTISIDAGVQVNEASVTTANIVTTNGVIHVIDAVLLPPGG